MKFRTAAAALTAAAITLTGCSAPAPAPSPTPPPDAELTVCFTLAAMLREKGETYSSSKPVAEAVQNARVEVGGVEDTLNERLNDLIRASIPHTPDTPYSPRIRAASVVRYSAALEQVAERCQSLSEVRGWGK